MSLKRGIVFLYTLSLFFLTLSFFPVTPSFPQSQSYSDKDCLSCHGKPAISQITKDGKTRSLYVNPEEWARDIHNRGKITCVDCHVHANPYFHFREGFFDVDCARCHPEEAEEYQKNIHLTFAVPSGNKEFPLCYHCHTKHHVLPHDDPLSSIHEKNVGNTCGECHPEVMVEGILGGTSLGKVSGHRKGDLAERFDMKVCISCHYEDSAHGAKRVYKDFCPRCHDVRSKGNLFIGPTHLSSLKWKKLNIIGSGLIVFFLLGMCVFAGYVSRKKILNTMKNWVENMKVKEDKEPEEETAHPVGEGQGEDLR